MCTHPTIVIGKVEAEAVGTNLAPVRGPLNLTGVAVAGGTAGDLKGPGVAVGAARIAKPGREGVDLTFCGLRCWDPGNRRRDIGDHNGCGICVVVAIVISRSTGHVVCPVVCVDVRCA